MWISKKAFGVFLLEVGLSSAFSTPSRMMLSKGFSESKMDALPTAAGIRARRVTALGRSGSLGMSEEEYEYVEDTGAVVEPQPPDYPPSIDAQLEGDLLEADRRIMLYEKEIEMMREQIDLKCEELLEEQNSFRSEKASLVDKIAEFTVLLSQRDDELAEQAQNSSAESNEKESELQKEIDALKSDLAAKTEAYKEELEATKELKTRFEEANDKLEFEQMEFMKEKRALQSTIDGERKNIKSLENKLRDSESAFEKIREELMGRIQNEQERLMDTEGAWETTKEALRSSQKTLQDQLREKEESLAESKRELRTQKDLFAAERAELKNKIQAEQITLKRVRQELKQEQQEFDRTKKALENDINDEQKALRRLQEQMEREQSKFDDEREKLQVVVQRESDRLTQLETELASERDNYTKMKEKLESKLANEERVGKLKKRQMNERYTKIREEMTKLWEGAKRDARKEQERLRNKYTKKLDDVSKKVIRLEDDLNQSQESGNELKLLLAEAEAQKKLLIAQSSEMENKYKGIVEERDAMIVDLRENVAGLNKIIREKDAIIEEQQKELGRYKNSFRSLAKLSVAVTGNKLKDAGGTFIRLIQNSPPEDED